MRQSHSQHRARVLFALAAALLAPAQNSSASAIDSQAFRRLSVDQGLSHRSVYTIAQDRSGYLWIGTEDGLNRYDGRRFTVFQNDPANAASIGNNDIASLQVDAQGRMWIGTWGAGIDRYDPQRGTFTHFRANAARRDALQDDRVQVLAIDAAQNVWAGTFSGGLSRIAPNGTITTWRHRPDDPSSLTDDRIWSIAVAPDAIWVGTDKGLDRLDVRSGAVQRIALAGAPSPIIIRTLLRDPDGTLWIGTQQGLARLDRDGVTIAWDRHDPADETTIGDDSINKIFRDSRGQLWLGTNGGGVSLRVGNAYRRYRFRAGRADTISDDDIRAFYEDRSHNLWIGTRGGGLNRLDLKPQSFRAVTNDPTDPASLLPGGVVSILEDGANLWLGSANGITRYDRATGALTHFRPERNRRDGLRPSPVQSMLRDRRGDLWLGFWRGAFCQFDVATGTCISPEDPLGPSDTVTSMLQSRDGSIWIASTRGVHRYDENMRRITTYRRDASNANSLSDDYVWCLYEDRGGALWIGTDNGGVDRLDPRTQTFTHFRESLRGLSNNRIRGFHDDGAGSIWIATARGLNRLDVRSGNVRHYLERDGLTSNSIFGVAGDGNDIWVTSAKGISRIDRNTGAIANYTITSGDQRLSFDTGAMHAGRSGTIYAGAGNGFVSFVPRNVRGNPHLPQIVITGVRQFGASLPLPSSTALRLEHDDNFFTVGFAALEFTNPTENRFRYRLEGFDRNWIDAGTSTEATYTNVPPGNYVFRVIGSNDAGVWNERGAQLPLAIAPPFWQTAWFRLGALAAVLALLVLAYRLRMRSMHARERELQTLVDARTRELTLKNRQLEHVSEIAAAINSELDFDRVVDMLLSLLPKCDVAMALVHDSAADAFRLRAALGWDPSELQDIVMTLAQIETQYLADATPIAHDLFVRREDVSRDIVTMRIVAADKIEGFLVFEYRTGQHSLADLQLLADVRVHIVSAFERARVLSDLARVNDSRNEFVGIAAHHLQTPLGVIAGWVTIVMEKLGGNAFDRNRALEQLARVKRAAEEMEKLVRDLLDITSIEAGRAELDRHSENLRELIGERIRTHAPLAERKDIRLTLDVGEDGAPPVLADVARISEVLDNLLSNAIKYTHRGGEVRVTYESHGSEVITHVQDNGQGLSEEDMKNVFRTFRRLSARPTAGEPSTGLGLAIVKRIVEIHGGRVWVTSEVGRGATFSFSLPAA